MIVGMPLSASAGTIGSVPPERTSSGRRPKTCSKLSCARRMAGASGGISPGRASDQRSISTSAPAGAASRSSRSTSGATTSGCWPGARRIDTFASAMTGSTVFWSLRRAALDAVDVERRLGPRAEVELACRVRVGGPGALVAQQRVARHERRPVGELLLRRRHHPGAERLGEPAVARKDSAEGLHERVRRVEGGTAVQARVQVARAGAHAHVEVHEPARGDGELGDAAPGHPAVEDHGCVGAALVLG